MPDSTETLTTSLSPPGTGMLLDCVPALMLQEEQLLDPQFQDFWYSPALCGKNS